MCVLSQEDTIHVVGDCGDSHIPQYNTSPVGFRLPTLTLAYSIRSHCTVDIDVYRPTCVCVCVCIIAVPVSWFSHRA